MEEPVGADANRLFTSPIQGSVFKLLPYNMYLGQMIADGIAAMSDVWAARGRNDLYQPFNGLILEAITQDIYYYK